MATFSINTLTEKGTEMMATALATGQGIEFTGLAIGDGAAPENPETLTALVNKVMDVEISKVYRAASEPGTSIFRASFQNKTGSAFRFREAGIFARLQGTADDPILYGYANAGDTADLIDTVEEGSLLMQTLLCNIVTGSADVQLIDNPSALITRQDLLEYLPLTGGAMTGDNVVIYKQDTSGRLCLTAGTDTEDGAGLYMSGENFTGSSYISPGSFLLRAAGNGSYIDLRGTSDGTLTWRDSAVLTAAGGTLNAPLYNTSPGNPVIRNINGGALFLFSIDDPAYKGGFILRAYSTNDQFIDLQGWADGRLHWNGNDILTTAGGNVSALTIASKQVVTLVATWKSGKSWYRKYSDGWIEQGGEVAVRGNTKSWETVTFPTAFSNTNYTIITSSLNADSDTNYTDSAATVRSRTVTSCALRNWDYQGNTWYACGY